MATNRSKIKKHVSSGKRFKELVKKFKKLAIKKKKRRSKSD